MLRIATLTVALALAGLTVPAFARTQSNDGFAYAGAEESGYQLQQYRYFTNEEKERHPVWRQAGPAGKATAPAAAKGSIGGFTYRGDGTGWEIAPHKYVFSGGTLAMSDDCDHAIRIVQGPSPAEVDASRNMSPGA